MPACLPSCLVSASGELLMGFLSYIAWSSFCFGSRSTTAKWKKSQGRQLLHCERKSNCNLTWESEDPGRLLFPLLASEAVVIPSGPPPMVRLLWAASAAAVL